MPGSGDAAFKQALRNVRDDKIKPILEEARTPFVEKGLRSEIVTSDDLSITLILQPDPGVRAELKYQAVVEKRRVYVLYTVGPVIPLGSTVMFAGSHRPGDYLPEELTTELVDSHVNTLLEALKGELEKISGAGS